MEIRLNDDVWPEIISILDFGMRYESESNSITALLAFPSVAGARTFTTNVVPSSVILSWRLLGLTFKVRIMSVLLGRWLFFMDRLVGES